LLCVKAAVYFVVAVDLPTQIAGWKGKKDWFYSKLCSNMMTCRVQSWDQMVHCSTIGSNVLACPCVWLCSATNILFFYPKCFFKNRFVLCHSNFCFLSRFQIPFINHVPDLIKGVTCFLSCFQL
jgi:hypothetical protein